MISGTNPASGFVAYVALFQCIVEGFVHHPLPLLEARYRAIFTQTARLLELPKCSLHAIQSALQGGVGVEHQLETHAVELVKAEYRRFTADHYVDQLRRTRQTGRNRAQLINALRGLNEGDVGTVLGAGKDALARKYVSLATQTRTPSLNLQALFSGTEGG